MFSKSEHPIPESLGNDDFILEPGFVCDSCNQYFGSKVEEKVLSKPPFGIERVRRNVTTKKGKIPNFSFQPHLELFATPFQNQVVMTASPEYWKLIENRSFLVLPYEDQNDFFTTRLLIKMGLEILLTSETIDPYTSRFDRARTFSRFPSPGLHWEIAYGLYPSEKDLVISEREDEISPLITEQLYEYSMGEMLNGDIILCFVYRAHVYACNLVQPSIGDYAKQFNLMNKFILREIEVATK